jgi:exodeoxyribonuclease V alpha subunit
MVNELRKALRLHYITDKDQLDILIDKIALMKNPYEGIGEYPIGQKGGIKTIKITFTMVDRLCYILEYNMDSFERYSACINYQLDFGNDLYLTPEDMVKTCCNVLLTANARLGIDTEDSTVNEKVVKIITDMIERGRIRHHPDKRRGEMTLEKYYKFEYEIASFIRDNLKKSIVNFYEKLNPTTLAKDQLEAVKILFGNVISILTGGPGTGKTYVISFITKFIIENGYPVYLCTPTGISSSKVNDYLFKNDVKTATFRPKCRTMHKFIHLITEIGKGKNPDIEMLALTNMPKFFIIDETSMISIDILYQFLKRVQLFCNTHFIFVGDPDQLPSVGLGNFFKDIISEESIPHATLTIVKRQDKGSELLKHLSNVRNGDGTSLTKLAKKDCINVDSCINIKVFNDNNELRELVLAEYDRKTTQILCPRNVTVEFVNDLAQNIYNKSSQMVIHRDKVFKLGDPIVICENNYEKGKNGTFNGDLAEIVGIELVDRNQVIDLLIKGTGEKIRYFKAEFDQLALAYAITVHKSQSMEYPKIIFIYDISSFGSAKYFANRNLIYTAMSRAKDNLLILCQEGCQKNLKVSVMYKTKPRLTAFNWFFRNNIRIIENGKTDEDLGSLIPESVKASLPEYIKKKTGKKVVGGKRSNALSIEDSTKITDFFTKKK